MWNFVTSPLANDHGSRTTVEVADGPASIGDVLRAWQADADFRSRFTDHLAAAPYRAFRWETPATTADTLTRPFEFVIVDSPEIDRRPDPDSFADHFVGDAPEDDPGIVTFPNLGRNAILVVPCPVAPAKAYTHLAAFVRGAPDRQRHAFWQAVAGAMLARVGDRPVWLSTAGGGVAWLHVRLDDSPKYYRHRPYQSVERSANN